MFENYKGNEFSQEVRDKIKASMLKGNGNQVPNDCRLKVYRGEEYVGIYDKMGEERIRLNADWCGVCQERNLQGEPVCIIYFYYGQVPVVEKNERPTEKNYEYDTPITATEANRRLELKEKRVREEFTRDELIKIIKILTTTN